MNLVRASQLAFVSALESQATSSIPVDRPEI